MKLRKLDVERFRSLRSFDLELDNFLVLVGENNHGKSNTLHALQAFLSRAGREISKDDFYNKEISEPIRITATFGNLTPGELEKLQAWVVEGKLMVTKEYILDSENEVTINYYAFMKVPENSWLDENFPDYHNREVVSKLPLYGLLPQSGRITKDNYSDAVKNYTLANQNTIKYKIENRKNPTGFRQLLRAYLPEFHLVPAIRDVADETRASTSATLFGRILAVVVERIARNNPAFQKLAGSLHEMKMLIQGSSPEHKIAEIKDLEEKMKTELSAWGVGVSIGVDTPDPRDVIAAGTHITIDDGIATDISFKGHGLQRAFLFALIHIWASTLGESTEIEGATIFAFEEPELFLHPQVCRATYEALKKISTVDQVVICSHSPQFINLEDYRSIAVIRKKSSAEGTKAFSVKQDLFQLGSEDDKRFKIIQFFNPDRNELFFARKVILTEGASEKAVLPLLARRVGVYDHRVSIVDCSSKFNLVPCIKVLNAFEIPYLVVHDDDPVDPSLQPGNSKYDPQRLAEANHLHQENRVITQAVNQRVGSVEIVSPDLEAFLGISGSRVDAVGKPYATIEKFADEHTSIPPKVSQLVCSVFSPTQAS